MSQGCDQRWHQGSLAKQSKQVTCSETAEGRNCNIIYARDGTILKQWGRRTTWEGWAGSLWGPSGPDELIPYYKSSFLYQHGHMPRNVVWWDNRIYVSHQITGISWIRERTTRGVMHFEQTYPKENLFRKASSSSRCHSELIVASYNKAWEWMVNKEVSIHGSNSFRSRGIVMKTSNPGLIMQRHSFCSRPSNLIDCKQQRSLFCQKILILQLCLSLHQLGILEACFLFLS